jgi:hypothetical protein
MVLVFGSAAGASERRHVEVKMAGLPIKSDADTFLGRPLFDSRLTREFRKEYEKRFGYPEVEQDLEFGNKYTFYEIPGGKFELIEDYTSRQKKFTGYMYRRLTEHHFDFYARTKPKVRTAYEFKERISNVDVKVRNDYRLRMRYDYGANRLDARLENPYSIETKLTMEMGDGFGPSAVERTLLSVSYHLTPMSMISACHEIDHKASTSLVGLLQLTRILYSTLTIAKNAAVDREEPQTSPRHDLLQISLAWAE